MIEQMNQMVIKSHLQTILNEHQPCYPVDLNNVTKVWVNARNMSIHCVFEKAVKFETGKMCLNFEIKLSDANVNTENQLVGFIYEFFKDGKGYDEYYLMSLNEKAKESFWFIINNYSED